ncbi:hypothetical protein Ancab_037482 [Ancistrocladus abbreviatus]
MHSKGKIHRAANRNRTKQPSNRQKLPGKCSASMSLLEGEDDDYLDTEDDLSSHEEDDDCPKLHIPQELREPCAEEME